MKNILLILTMCTVFIPAPAKAQQWVDKQYSYDSIHNIPYGTAVNFAGEIDTLYLNLYLPISDQQSAHPLLVWIHGGGFIAGSKDDRGIRRMCRMFASRGYVTATIGYRLGYVSDDRAWTCNLPDYSCYFATDSAEWVRAYYRSVQDAKGAIRFLVNRQELYGIDVQNIFLAGESAGAFAALGAGLLDMTSERPPETFALSDAPIPHTNTANCPHNMGKSFTAPIPRPDLGGIDGEIEPTSTPYTIKGIANIFGGMLGDLLKDIPTQKHKPAIYSFHQPCDLLVPIDSNHIYWGITWCLTNGYNCYGIAHTIKVYGSRAFSGWNSLHGYGYHIENQFTSVNFPYSYWNGQASCIDQVVNDASCHSYDNLLFREEEIATFFSGLITPSNLKIGSASPPTRPGGYTLHPNPASDVEVVYLTGAHPIQNIVVRDVTGRIVQHNIEKTATGGIIRTNSLPTGTYFVCVTSTAGATNTLRMVKR